MSNVMSNAIYKSILLLVVLAQPVCGWAADDFGFNLAVVYGPRDIEGDIFVSRSPITSGKATADSLGLGTSKSPQVRVGMRYKRWNISLDYLPTSYSGQGLALTDVNFPNRPPIAVATPISSNIDVEMILGSVMYDLFVGESWKLALGGGFGRTDLDIALVPDVGQPLAFDGNTPFGYLGGQFIKQFGRVSLLAGVQGISAEFDSSRIKYGNVNLAGSWRWHAGSWWSDLVLGYRRVDFKMEFDIDGQKTAADFTQTGPYLGVVAGF
jgi:hypothetical protein